jgi:thiol-disulfide isomerase/thioredoxin
MRKSLLILALLPFALAQAEESLPKLYPGAKAPEIKVSEWVKNGELPSGKLRVVEFWATWCGPCRASIPHLTELAKKYADKVDFAGISVYEHGDKIPELVKKFVADMGDKMDYHVALDATDKFMATNWMEAAEQPGIPTAFLVDGNDVVVWIGHPMNLEEPLKQAIEGKLDAEKVKKEFLDDINKQRESQKVGKEIQGAIADYKAGKKDVAEQRLDALVKANPEMTSQIQRTRLFQMYAPTDPACKELVKKLLKGKEEDLTVAVQYASRLASTKDGDKKTAKDIARAVIKKAKTTLPLYVSSYVLFNTEDYKETLKAITKTLSALEKDPQKADIEKQVTAGMTKLKTDTEAKLNAPK